MFDKEKSYTPAFAGAFPLLASLVSHLAEDCYRAVTLEEARGVPSAIPELRAALVAADCHRWVLLAAAV